MLAYVTKIRLPDGSVVPCRIVKGLYSTEMPKYGVIKCIKVIAGTNIKIGEYKLSVAHKCQSNLVNFEWISDTWEALEYELD